VLDAGRHRLDLRLFERAHHRLGRLVDGKIEVVDRPAQHGVAHTAADEARGDAAGGE
jgi:hypothetical protein